ncbi:MAG: sugar phosphate isomerase/epimerase [Oscillospiraceae bacterium]|nr:sugar phosphate isomerase/epimerase [Oscillospiraceae bacterium]
MKKVYIQTYSLGDNMAKDFEGSLKKLSEMGYCGVEFAGGYGGKSAEELIEILKKYKLDAISSHVRLDIADDEIEFLAKVGARYIICPMAVATTYDEAISLAGQLNAVGERCKKYGLKYGYHNHTQEFMEIDGKYLLEILIENTDPDKVVFQLDVGWCTTAGVNAVDFINKYAGRFELIHAKEAGKVTGVQKPLDFSGIQRDESGRPVMTPEFMKLMEEMNETRKMNSPQGKGIVDWKGVKTAADAQGARAYIVEREWDYLDDIFQCVKEDVEFMKTV